MTIDPMRQQPNPTHTLSKKHPNEQTTQLLERQSGKAPWRFIAALEVEQLCFGTVPPRVQHALALYDAEKRVLWISFDVAFETSGFQSVVMRLSLVCRCLLLVVVARRGLVVVRRRRRR